MIAQKIKIGKPIHPDKLKGVKLEDIKSQSEIVAKTAERLSSTKTKTEKCWICNSSDARDIIVVYGVPFVECQNCSHIYRKYTIPEKMAYDFFDNDEEINCHLHQFNYRAKHVSKPKVDLVMKLIKRNKGRWLDMGCGSGELLYYVKDRYKWEAIGFDISGAGVKIAQIHGVTVYKSDLFQYYKNNEQPFDVISTTGYFDLVSYPVKHLAITRKLLKPKGLLMVSYPRFDSFTGELIKLFPKNAIRYCTPLDRSVFTKRSMRKFLEDNGFKIIFEWRFGLDFYTFMSIITMKIPELAESKINRFFTQHYNEFQKIFDKHNYNDNLFFIAQKKG